MQIAEVVALPPACCAICKSGNAEEKHPFIDTQAHYPQGQRVDRIYICFNCVKVLGNLHGFISPEEAEVKDHQIDALEQEVAHLEAKNKAFNDIQSALDVFNPPKEPETVLPEPEEKPKKKPGPKPKAKPVEEDAEAA